MKDKLFKVLNCLNDYCNFCDYFGDSDKQEGWKFYNFYVFKNEKVSLTVRWHERYNRLELYISGYISEVFIVEINKFENIENIAKLLINFARFYYADMLAVERLLR